MRTESVRVGDRIRVEYEITYIGHTASSLAEDQGTVVSVKGLRDKPEADVLVLRQEHRTMGSYATHVIGWKDVRMVTHL